MGLTTSLKTAVAGLSATQIGIGVVSQNVSNANTAGYVRRTVSTVDTTAGATVSTNTTAVQRLLDRIVQSQLWQESSAAAYTSTRADALSQLDKLYGAPGSSTALDTVYNGFTTALQALQNDPSSYTNRTGVLDAANQLASRLNSLSDGVQSMRQQAESGIASGVSRINELLDGLTSVNAKIVGAPNDQGKASLLDQRDKMVAELSQYVDIRTSEDPRGSLSIVTKAGTQIFDGRPAVKFSFDEHTSLDATSQWSTNAAQRSVGTITMIDMSGNKSDAIANGTFRSGEIAAYIDLRDNTLVKAQAQLDEIAAQMSSALSDKEVAGTAATSGAATGYQVDLSGLQAGNTVTLDYKVTPGGQTQRFTFVRVDSAASLPLPASASGDAANKVVGIDFSGGAASIQTQIQAALGTGFSATVTGTTMQIVDDGAAGTRDVLGLTARPTNSSLSSAGGAAELPLFVDGANGSTTYTGSFEGGSQAVGYAGRITVNPAVIANRALLVTYDTTTAAGDATRPQLMLERLTQSQRSLTTATGLDGSTATSSATVTNLVQRVINSQAQSSASAQSVNEGQQVALASVQSRFQADSQVNVDQEMSNLIELQAAYAANARIISTVKEMMDVLMRV